MTWVLSALAVVALLTLTGLAVYSVRVLLRVSEPPKPVVDSADTAWKLRALEERADKQSARLDELKLAISDGIARNDRADKRIEKTVARARRQLAAAGLEDAGLEAEADELRGRDGDPGPELELLTVSEDLAEYRPSGIPGVSMAELDALRERRGA